VTARATLWPEVSFFQGRRVGLAAQPHRAGVSLKLSTCSLVLLPFIFPAVKLNREYFGEARSPDRAGEPASPRATLVIVGTAPETSTARDALQRLPVDRADRGTR